MKIITLRNIIIFIVLLRAMLHIFFDIFVCIKKKENFVSPQLWAIFKIIEIEHKRKILTEQESDDDNFITNFIRDNNVDVSDMFLFLIDTKMLESANFTEEEKSTTSAVEETTEEKKRKRSYRACCKAIGEQCEGHRAMKIQKTSNEKKESLNEGKHKIKRMTNTENFKSSKNTSDKSKPSRCDDTELSNENVMNKGEPILVPRVPRYIYKDRFLNKCKRKIENQNRMNLLEIYKYKSIPHIFPGNNESQETYASAGTSYNNELGKLKSSFTHNANFGENIDEYNSEESTDTEEESESSHEIWEENETEENSDSGSSTDTSPEALVHELDYLLGD
ncbi:hypothetical protein PGO_130210 [Plasmodium gonderi]|uniref:Uncharacterized protein n=1 Tax=Plasmodium gonderi TaxID=77519 RepID=A0A1Y1JJR3_PLAGO|nr:hypothetical protein PGO_130210 [Plasmodium gonderi]GAW82749.1 hypothetical protein PGO_130210 [Plasmodium gonderi]